MMTGKIKEGDSWMSQCICGVCMFYLPLSLTESQYVRWHLPSHPLPGTGLFTLSSWTQSRQSPLHGLCLVSGFLENAGVWQRAWKLASYYLIMKAPQVTIPLGFSQAACFSICLDCLFDLKASIACFRVPKSTGIRTYMYSFRWVLSCIYASDPSSLHKNKFNLTSLEDFICNIWRILQAN